MTDRFIWQAGNVAVLEPTKAWRTKAAIEETPALQRLAQQLEPTLRRAFMAAVRQLQSAIDLNALAAAIEANQLTMAEAAAKLATFPEVFGELAVPLRAAFIAGAGVAIHELGKSD